MDTPLNLTRDRAISPFQSGDLIRPRTPRHPWRAHRIQVKTCYQDKNARWVMEIRTYMGDTLTTLAPAVDFEKAPSIRSVS
ncbi:MAG: hypothetical protein QNJ46_03385 [Leptolyngbyaceae cyanobacterium MO_188.B28]|nr:hypothetical protein [Leptolyngbyaceae cyanobacterium MO_188.B28]